MGRIRIESRQAKIAVIGLGYVGLPLCVALVKAGFKVIGIDYNKEWVKLINEGKSNIMDVPNEVLEGVIASGGLKAYWDYGCISEADVVMICVPTPLNDNKEPDLSYIKKAVASFLPYMHKGMLISLESTTYPGTTKELIVDYIESKKNWHVGEDFYVCYSPERVDPGNKTFFVGNTPKVVGGSTEKCLELGLALYEAFLPKVVGVSSTEVAEMTKVLENTFRCVNIAFINEMTMMCERMGIDIWEVIKGASSKPFGFMPFYPGPGVGGHCIPLDPLYLSWEVKKYNYFSRFIETASDINCNMPHYVVGQITKILGCSKKSVKGSRILLLGLSYKKDVGDVRESPSLEVYELLKEQGAELSIYDPFIRSYQCKSECLPCCMLTDKKIEKADLVVVLTDHSNVDYMKILEKATCIYDTRNVYKEVKSDKIIKLGQKIIK